jgi:hypothetical protein
MCLQLIDIIINNIDIIRINNNTNNMNNDINIDNIDNMDVEYKVENYLRSLDDVEGILKCYNDYGAVGITGILTKEECDETVRDVERILLESGIDKSFDINNPLTFDHTIQHVGKYGLVGKEPLLSAVLNRNRFHANVKKAYSIVYGLKPDQLLACYDRLGWMRPTIGPNGEDWSRFDTPFNLGHPVYI